jgi:hypothetical protein
MTLSSIGQVRDFGGIVYRGGMFIPQRTIDVSVPETSDQSTQLAHQLHSLTNHSIEHCRQSTDAAGTSVTDSVDRYNSNDVAVSS